MWYSVIMGNSEPVKCQIFQSHAHRSSKNLKSRSLSRGLGGLGRVVEKLANLNAVTKSKVANIIE